jgi:AcrR family transcriptional regulator
MSEKPASGGWRARRRAATIDVIIDAALSLTAREGLHALTMHRIAADVGCVVSALYRYFENKDALFLAMQARVLKGLSADLADAALAVVTDDPLTRLVAVLIAYRELPRRRPADFALLHRWLGDPSFAVDTAAARAQWQVLLGHFAPIIGLLETCVAAGRLEPGDAHARLYVLWGALQGALQLNRFDRLEEPGLQSHDNATLTLRALLVGFGATSTAVDGAFARVDTTPPPPP